MRTRSVPILFCVALCPALVSCGTSSSEQSHVSAPTVELEPTSQTVFGEQLLLYLEHAHVVRGQSTRFLAHLSVLATGEPVRSGRVVLELGEARLTAEAPKRDGLFIPEGSLAATGSLPARLVVESEQASETLELAQVVVHADEESARRVAEEAGEGPANPVHFLMEQQWKVKLLLATATHGTLSRRLVVPAQVRTPEGSEAAISSPVAGRLLAGQNARLPKTGEQVEAGQLMAEIEPPLGAIDIAQLQALRLELDLKALDITRALSEARAHVDFSQREHERISRLREKGLSTRQALDEAERDLRVAQSELEAATATKESLDLLLEQRGAPATGGSLTIRLPIVAPLGGTVVAAPQVQGASVEPGQELFHVLETSRVWIEGRVSEFDLHLLGSAPSAVVTFDALPGKRVQAGGSEASRALRLLPLLDSASRTAVLRCELPNSDGAIKAGMLAELEIATETVEAEVVIPTEAIVVDQSLPTAYVMVGGEVFQKRELELGVKDGERVEVLRGIAPGEHVATRGAYVVKLAALSPASFGPGHQH